MQIIDKIYINGAFVRPHGNELFDLYNPATEQVIGRVRLADEADACDAIAAAKRAFPAFSRTDKHERIDMLKRMHEAVVAKEAELFEAIIEEYGAPASRGRWMAQHASDVLLEAAKVLEDYSFTRRAGTAEVVMQPLGVAGLITPWNSDAGFICGKLAAALAAGCTAVLKPSEMSAIQTRVVTEALHEAGLPQGVFNIVTGRGETVGAQISSHRDVAKLSFTGSTPVGKTILRTAADTLKRVTLELGGKSPVIVLDDANFDEAVPIALQAGFMNSGQACIAGTRILVPESRRADFEARVVEAVAGIQAGNPRDPRTSIGPMVSQKQWDRVQRYIRIGMDEGARLIAGGEGRPHGVEAGWFVRPTVFSDVTNDMTMRARSIRSGALDHRVPRHRGRDCDCQRYALWPPGLCALIGCRACTRGGIKNRSGTCARQHACARARCTIRRLQAIGYRTRVRHVRAGNVSRAEVGARRNRLSKVAGPYR